MTLTAEQKKGGEFVDNLLKRAWGNAEFKQQLIANPKTAIESATSTTLNLPEGVSLSVNDQSDKEVFYFNIPPRPDLENMELSDEQLEIVAGGEVAVCTTVVSYAVSGAVAGAVVGVVVWAIAAS